MTRTAAEDGDCFCLTPRPVTKTMLMRYLIFAAFYKNADDFEARYRVPVSVREFQDLSFLKPYGLEVHIETNGYMDFRREVGINELVGWVEDGYEDELNLVLSRSYSFEKILIQVVEMDEEYGFVGMRICDTKVDFTGTEELSRVEFTDIKGDGPNFHIPLHNLKMYFSVLTLLEVVERLKVFGTGTYWSTKDLKEYFESGVDEAVAIASTVFRNKRDLDGNPDILHSIAVGIAGQTKNEKIVGFLHDVVEDSDVTFNDLDEYGFSAEVLEALKLLTHDKKRMSYDEYVRAIIASGNSTAINVKINDLRNNIARAGNRHKRILEKHTAALALVLESIHKAE